MGKKIVSIVVFVMIALVITLSIKMPVSDNNIGNNNIISIMQDADTSSLSEIEDITKELLVVRILSGHDEDRDGIDDYDDIVLGARKDADNRPTYKSAYYKGGYPPENEGVCTDVIWRAFLEAGYNLKEMIDSDIQSNVNAYKRVVESGGPDSNIDFRRVPNLAVFFSKKSKELTIEINPNDKENLKEWQAGDIVVFGGRTKHIAIISDKRRQDGVPYIIHNDGPYTQEEDALIFWDGISKISHHFRWTRD